MFLLYRKDNGYVVGKMKDVGNISHFVRRNDEMGIRYIEVADSDIPPGDIRNYKVVDGVINALDKDEQEDLEKKKNPNGRITALEQENALLYSAIAELSILIGGGAGV